MRILSEESGEFPEHPPAAHGTGLERILKEQGPVYEAVADKTFEVSHTSATDKVHHIIRVCL